MVTTSVRMSVTLMANAMVAARVVTGPHPRCAISRHVVAPMASPSSQRITVTVVRQERWAQVHVPTPVVRIALVATCVMEPRPIVARRVPRTVNVSRITGVTRAITPVSHGRLKGLSATKTVSVRATTV